MTCPVCNATGKINGYQKQTMSHYSLTCSRCLGTGAPVLGTAYAGIGSRETPEPILREMGTLAMQMSLKGYILRSGAAKGADTAFERGCRAVGGRMVIRVPSGDLRALEHASWYHPNWQACDERAQALHARNSLIMCGDALDDPVRFVICWTPGGAVTGGTGQALRIAAAMNIPVFNLALPGHGDALRGWLAS